MHIKNILLNSSLLFLFLCSVVLFQRCGEPVSDKNNTVDSTIIKNNSGEAQTDNLYFLEPKNRSYHIVGDSVLIRIAKYDSTKSYDSLVFFVNGKKKHFNPSSGSSYFWKTNNQRVGFVTVKVDAYTRGSKETQKVSFHLVSDKQPEKLSYKLIKKFPHDPKAYTQGLLYENGFMYEGTGQHYESTLRKIKFETGELLQSYALPKDVFGEGIVCNATKIFQLTWRSREVYVFDKESFKLINKFPLQTREGWGITNYGENFIMSDGVTSNLYVIDPEFFTELDRFEVYDNIGPRDSLNELEYIDGKIYANIWQTTKIIVVDPATGKVEQELDLKALVPEQYIGDDDNVLNGIAYNPSTGNLYVTGKRWPTLFEISVSRP